MSIDTVADKRRGNMVLRFREHGIPVVYNANVPMRLSAQAFFYQGSRIGVTAILSYDSSMDQWAAYIGGSLALTEEEIIQEVLSHGAKMSEDDARKLFPVMADVEYRR